MIAATFDGTYNGWRTTARGLVSAGAAPEDVLWTDGSSLFSGLPESEPGRPVKVSKRLLEIAQPVACHRDFRKWSLLYRVLYRTVHGERELLHIESDPDVRDLFAMEHEVRHDIHRMHAFVRFRRVEGSDPEQYVAWHQPDHLIVRRTAPWFAERFAGMKWSILTPDASAYWDGSSLSFGPGVARSQAPAADDLEDLWRAYYSSIFNPARVNADLMKQHMPARYWSTMPETETISKLVSDASARQCGMLETAPVSAAAFLPQKPTIPLLRDAVHSCRGCELYQKATQPVFSEGPVDAALVLVGEQPGDQEDIAGRNFVGPSGQLLDRALDEAGIDRSSLYITGAVKHFRFEERGKRRIHKTASKAQVSACQPWIDAEMELVRPKLILCMGKTAALSILGRDVTLAHVRGQVLPHRRAGGVLVTVHPSYLLRVPDPTRQAEEYAAFLRDLRMARTLSQAA